MRSDKERAYDGYLAASSRLGDRDALSRLAERWQPKLLAHAWRLTGEHDLASDAAQDAWIEIMRGIGGLDDAEAFPAWAFRIVSRRCARIIRGRQRGRRTQAALAREPDAVVETPERAHALSDFDAVQLSLIHISEPTRPY